MARENRALLTRDRRLLMHAIVQHGYYPRSQNADEQTIEVIRRFDLSELIAPFTRCLRCNAPLEEAAKADIIDKLEPLTKIYYDQFRRCPDCKQIYWSGRTFLNCKSGSKKFAPGSRQSIGLSPAQRNWQTALPYAACIFVARAVCGVSCRQRDCDWRYQCSRPGAVAFTSSSHAPPPSKKFLRPRRRQVRRPN